jgi:K+-sensing histidine kinase KdpD
VGATNHSAKNALKDGDAQRIENAFQAKLQLLQGSIDTADPRPADESAIANPAKAKSRKQFAAQTTREHFAAYEKAKQPPAYLELAKTIAEKQAVLKCPPNYKELDSRQDRRRLKELEAESNKRPLAAAEEIEQRHLQARLDAYSRTAESADCERMNLLKALSADLRTPEEKEELARLEARYPEVPLDTTLIERGVLLAAEANRRVRQHWRQELEAEKRLTRR